jgi:hypothetical protein
MEKNIINQLDIIEKAIKWVKETESMSGAKGENAYQKLVNYRRKLNKKKYAVSGNPAIAIYGASQMGKSYLVSNLLSEAGTPFNVIDGQGGHYIFLDDINPEGRKKEATSIVTRFSTNYKWQNPSFPVKVKLLTPADLVLVLCDTYYNDIKIKIDTALKVDIINEKINKIYIEYCEKPNQQTFLNGDSVLDILDYFKANISTKGANVIHSSFFEKIPSVIEKIKPNQWSNVFSLLWNENENINKLFENLLENYSKVSFCDEIYVPINAVLRQHGTILDVSRLIEIYGEKSGTELNYVRDTSVLFFHDGQEKVIEDFSKAFLCALAAELTFCLPKELEKSKAFLENSDLLDFPGTRNRLGVHEEEILNDDMPKMLLRGKLSYLFNKYSYSEKINILLFCQNNEKVEVQNIVPDLLNDWINEMVGRTPEDRNRFISNAKLSPLFIISTMFNIDMEFDYNNDRPNNVDSRNNRWKGRFITVFNEIFGSNKWLTEWTSSNRYFQNIYMLRDFRFSADTASKLFKGYNENNIENEEIFHDSYKNFRQDLKKSFIEHEFVKKHFENPEESWDRAASINEDGSKLIIEKLNVASRNINIARIDKTLQEIKSIQVSVLALLMEYYNSTDKADSLLKAIETAGNVQANLAIAFGRDPYFFGRLMRELMITNTEVFGIYINKIRDIEKKDVVNMDQYIGIRLQVPEIDPNASYETNLEYLRRHFEIRTIEQCRKFFEEEKGIDVNELFYGNKERVKSFSQVLAIELEKYWFEHHIHKNEKFISEIVTREGFYEIHEMFRRLYEKLYMNDKIAERIRRYVDGYRNIEDVYEMIADISAEIFNNFVKTIGSDYYNESNYDDLKKAAENVNGLNWNHSELQYEINSKNEVSELINQMGNLSELLNENPLPKHKLKFLPNYRNYIIWYDLLKAGFVTASGVPNYDPLANEKLGRLIYECETIEF